MNAVNNTTNREIGNGRRRITDPPWSSHVAALVRMSGARVFPVFFPKTQYKKEKALQELIQPVPKALLAPKRPTFLKAIGWSAISR